MRRAAVMLALVILAGCESGVRGRADEWALYRNSPASAELRIHVATFDAADSGADFNRETCEQAAGLFNEYTRNYLGDFQQSLERIGGDTSDYRPIGYWCEQGRYRESGPVRWRLLPIDVPCDDPARSGAALGSGTKQTRPRVILPNLPATHIDRPHSHSDSS